MWWFSTISCQAGADLCFVNGSSSLHRLMLSDRAYHGTKIGIQMLESNHSSCSNMLSRVPCAEATPNSYYVYWTKLEKCSQCFHCNILRDLNHSTIGANCTHNYPGLCIGAAVQLWCDERYLLETQRTIAFQSCLTIANHRMKHMLTINKMNSFCKLASLEQQGVPIVCSAPPVRSIPSEWKYGWDH